MEEEIIYKVEVEGIQSIENLTKANKQLRAERNKLNLESEEGRKEAAKLNAQIDANTEKIKNNSSAMEKQRFQIGNYTDALDKLVPGLGATANGFTAMTQTAKAFILTPIGAVIGALGLAIGALTAYFKGSEEGQDSLSKVMNVGKVIFEQVTVVVEKLGEVLFKSISFVSSLAMKVIDFVAPAISQVLQTTLDAANQITELEDSIDARENELTVKRAENAKKVAQLREQALALEGDAKRKVIQEAIDLEKALAREETDQAANRLKLLEAQIAASGNATEEQKKERAELTAAKIQAETEEYSSTLKFQKEIEKLNDEAAKKRQERDEALAEETRLKNDLAEVNERLLKQSQTEIEQSPIIIKGKLDVNAANRNVTNTEKEQTKVKNLDFEAQSLRNQQTQIYQNSLNSLSATLRANTIASKAAASANALINTYLGATNVLSAKPPLPFPLNIIALTATIASGLTAVAQINNVKGFAIGGRVKSGDGTPIIRSNGDNILATVKTGEVILNENQQRRLGGDETFRRLGVPGFASGGIVSSAAQRSESISSQFALYEAIARITPIVTVEDINAGVNRVNVIDSRAQLV